jgi:diguanylate cyclase (GGDEF)-like protein
MLKRALIFSLFFMLMVVLLIKGSQLVLYYYIFFPLLLFPAYYFFENRDWVALISLFALVFLLFVYYFFQMPSWTMGFFGVGHASFLGTLAFYWYRWQRTVDVEMARCSAATEELEQLRRKHESRLESLHHLEKQVAGLLDLFEIARDFGECLGFDKISEILQKKVLPEIHFERMVFWIFARDKDKDRDAEETGGDVVLTISAHGVLLGASNVTEDELKLINLGKDHHRLVQSGKQWLFPLLTDGNLAACMLVEGAQGDDLAKFEVLSAYLALQVKKVQLYETVKELSIRDGLTGLFVRRHFLERFQEELKRCIRFNLPLAVLMLDIDHFKRYNDDYGHLSGDGTLKQVAAILKQSLRKVDIVARYGGEEFVMVIPETRREGAFEVAERIRSTIARHNFKIFNTETRVTVSIGLALYPVDLSDGSQAEFHKGLADELINSADKALYKAKEDGRNRVILFNDL